MSKYSVYSVSLCDLKDSDTVREIIDLLDVVFPETPKNMGSFLWKHNENPNGKSIVTIGRERQTGVLVAARALWRTDFSFNKKIVRCYQPCDTAVHPNHRRKGLFEETTLFAMKQALIDGCELLLNFPGPMSAPGYKKLGWTLSKQILSLVKPVQGLHIVRRLFQASKDRNSARSFIPTVPAVGCANIDWGAWSNVSYDLTPSNQIFLPYHFSVHKEWRYRDCSNVTYGKLASSGVLVVYRVGLRGGLKEVQVIDFMFEGGAISKKGLSDNLARIVEIESPAVITTLVSVSHPYFWQFIRSGFLPLQANVMLSYKFLDSSWADRVKNRKSFFAIMPTNIDTF